MIEFIDYKINSGITNMQKDSEILESAIKLQKKEAILRFYGWSPKCVSLGRNQDIKSINIEYCKNNKIDIVRRITGGRGLLHDYEVTYSFVCPFDFLISGNSIISSYKEISAAIQEGFLKYLGIKLEIGGNKSINTSFDYCMSLSTRADLCCNGKKVIGSAQYRKQNYILQHGSILFNYNPKEIENIFGEKPNQSSLTCIKELNQELNEKDIIDALKKGFKDIFTKI